MSAAAPISVRPLPDELVERIDLAAPVFADNGLDATRIAELARVTGIPRATLYYYFPGKEHILAHLLSRTLGQMTDRLTEAAELPGTGHERLTRLIRGHLVFISEHGPTYRLLFSELGRAAALVDIATGVDHAVQAPIRAALRDGIDDGTLRVNDIGAASSLVYGSVLVTGMQHLLLGSAIGLDEQADALIETLMGGLAPAETAPKGDDR